MKHQAKLRKPIRRELTQLQPIWVRVCHWGFASSLTVALLTGLELHKPASFLALHFALVLKYHVVSGWFSLGFVTIRLADTLIRRDDSIIPKISYVKLFPKLMAYYFFLRSSPPPSRKYNSGQLIIYSSWILLFLVASSLGLASYWQGKHLIWLWRMVGGFQILRWVKFSITIYFLATIPLHLYLSLTEDISRLQAMVTGYERKPPTNKR